MQLIAEITWQCPAKCQHCPIPKDKKTKTIAISSFRKALKLFADYFDGSRKILTISGGEPSLLNSLPDYVKAGRELGYKVTVITNGWNPDTILQAQPDYVQISVDAFENKQNSIRGLKLWTKILKLLDYIKEEKLKGFLRFTLTNQNLFDLITLREFLDEVGLQDVKIYAMPIRGCPEKAPDADTIKRAMEYAILPSQCPAGKGMFVLTPELKVLDCIFHRQELGKLVNFTFEELDKIVENGKKLKPFPCGEPYWWSH